MRARAHDSLDYVWVDTCCIDKSSSAELTEAINSMYMWYRDAAVCYVFLADLKPGTDADLERDLEACLWFTRGWTLQELIAPREVVFFDMEWDCRGRKKDLARLLSRITRIPKELLRGETELREYSVARRMSWAAKRKTTRLEDVAYCLVGIFAVSMYPMYGEGDAAFARLQMTVMQKTADLSIFTWLDDEASPGCPRFAGILAESPRQFARCDKIDKISGDSAYANFAITTRGIQIETSLLRVRNGEHGPSGLVLDALCRNEGLVVGICVRSIGGGLYARFDPGSRDMWRNNTRDLRRQGMHRSPVETLTLVTELPARSDSHHGLNPVLQNRCSALRVDWGPLLTRDFTYRPTSHWDHYDETFFGCYDDTKGWCAWFVSASIPTSMASTTKKATVRLFLGCFGWNRRRPNQKPPWILLANMESLDSATGRLVQSEMNHIMFECEGTARLLAMSAFQQNLDRTLIPTNFGWLTCLVDSGLLTRLNLKLEVRKQPQPEVCVNPVILISFSESISSTW